MGIQVDFDYSTWVATYPMFATLTPEQVVDGALPIAEIYWRNDGTGPARSIAQQTNILGLIVAHICQLMYGINGQSPSGLVGRISDATEGSVSVSTDFPLTPTNAWFMQTVFGAMFWQATAPYRTMRYVPGPRRVFNPWPNQ